MGSSLDNWKRSKLLEYRIYRFFYLFKLDNLRSILLRGILSQNEVKTRGLMSESFAEESCQEIRDNKKIYLSDGNLHELHDLIPLYFTPRTPTLFARKAEQNSLIFAEIESFVILDESISYAFSDGNATSHETRFAYDLKKLDQVNWDVIHANYWNNFVDGKRMRNAEFFIYPRIPRNRIDRFIVINNDSKKRAEDLAALWHASINIEVDKGYFFE